MEKFYMDNRVEDFRKSGQLIEDFGDRESF